MTLPARRAGGAGRQPVVGVLGGMGPEATVELMQRVIRATPARDDADHIRMLVDNNPKVPSRIKALIEGGGEDPGPVLAAMARGLEGAGADFLVIPCNTAHHYLPAVRAAVSIPVVDMVGLTVDRLLRCGPGPRRIGILASPAVRLTGLFDESCRQAGLAVAYPEGEREQEVLRIIRAVKAGDLREGTRAAYRSAALGLAREGADAILVACTELSALGRPDLPGTPLFDTLDTLVDEILARCLRGHGAPAEAYP